MKKHALTLLAIASVTVSSSAIAQIENGGYDNPEGIYVGASYGFLRVDGDDSFDDDKSVWDLRLGYSFNEYVSVDASYIDFGDYGDGFANAETDGYTLGLQLAYPFTDELIGYVRGGQLWYETTSNIGAFRSDFDDEGMYAGAGLGYKLSKNMLITFEYNVYDVGLDVEGAVEDIDDAEFSTDMKQAAVGIRYKF